MAHQMVPGSGSGMQFSGQPPSGDTTNTKIFVGGLAWETKSETLHRYFEQFGEILEAVVITDKHTGRSKGYGFVTFRDPESARKACANPNPVIDGRRANCNLASLGRPVRFWPYGHPRSVSPIRSPQIPRVPHITGPIYQLPGSYGYQPGVQYSSYRYPGYGPEYFYPQMYGMPGAVSPNTMMYGQMGQPSPSNFPYRTVRGYMIPGPSMLQYGRPIVCGVTTEVIPSMHSPNHPGIPLPSPGPVQVILPTSPQFTQSSGSDQMGG
ncbi:hypothetical protein M9H77_05127 [Catharanthus roseus]|uniref:Uncharacterized protein n=1 Tax=Catharanthus roseus TaxID=4058 RepID=A0ACC0CG14_CATRO|nr:hypothetical protein M9H77_05127 [Catharanthus roseus]